MAKGRRAKSLGAITRGLLIQSPHIEKVLSGKKTWEIRGYASKIRGPIALIRSGTTKLCYGVRTFRAFRLHAEPQTRLYWD